MVGGIQKLIWYSSPLETVGGGERLLLEGLKWFNEQGIEASLFADGEPVNKEALFNELYEPNIIEYNGTAKFGLIKVLKKVGFIKSLNPDIILANSQVEASRIYLHNLFSLRSIKYACFIHGSFFQFPDDMNKYSLIFRSVFHKILNNDVVYKELIPPRMPKISLLSRIKLEAINLLRYLAVRKASVVFVLTDKQKKEIELLYDHRNIVVNHGAFSKTMWNIRFEGDKKADLGVNGKFMFFSMCRLVAKKRVDLIIRSFAAFCISDKNAVLVIGGKGPEQEKLRQLTHELGIDQYVFFLGYVPDDQLLNLYASCDAFVTADNADYDITTFVALALGKKVVASAQHEFDQCLSELGLCFHANPDIEGFAEAFDQAKLVTVKQVTKERATEILSTYTWEHYFKKVLNNLV